MGRERKTSEIISKTLSSIVLTIKLSFLLFFFQNFERKTVEIEREKRKLDRKRRQEKKQNISRKEKKYLRVREWLSKRRRSKDKGFETLVITS